MDLGPDDVGYVCMPLFHSNAVQVGWAPSIVVRLRGRPGAQVLGARAGCPTCATTARRTSTTPASRSRTCSRSPSAPDDADNTLRVAFGNEGSPEVVDEFARRFGVEVIDAYGATEGGVAVNRDARRPRRRARARRRRTCRSSTTTATRSRGPRFDADGRLDERRGVRRRDREHRGRRPFEGYYNNPEATAKTTRFGWYWSGDLGYIDADGYLYFAGRNADWIRVDGENFPAGPIEEALRTHPDVVLAAVYGVPDDQAGDQVMAGSGARDGVDVRSGGVRGVARRAAPTIGPKWRPRYVRVIARAADHRHEQDRQAHAGAPEVAGRSVRRRPVFVRDRGEAAYRPFTASRRGRAARVVRRVPAASGSGISDVDLQLHAPPSTRSPPRSARGLRRTSSSRRRSTSLDEEIEWGRAWQAKLAADAGSGSTGRPSTAAVARRRSRSRSTTWSTRGRARCSR